MSIHSYEHSDDLTIQGKAGKVLPMPSKTTTKPANKFVSYLRVSSQQQGESGLGLDAQKEAVNRLVERRQGTIVETFEEIESGRKGAASRPALMKALKACKRRGAALVIGKLDRLSRDVRFFLEVLDDSKVDIRFADLPDVDPKTDEGRMLLINMANYAEFEGRRIGTRTRAALKAKVARDGQWDRKASHHLVAGAGQQAATAAVKAKADERAADLLPMIEQFKAEGFTTLAALADKLNQEQIATARNGKWTATAVKRVLERQAA